MPLTTARSKPEAYREANLWEFVSFRTTAEPLPSMQNNGLCDFLCRMMILSTMLDDFSQYFLVVGSRQECRKGCQRHGTLLVSAFRMPSGDWRCTRCEYCSCGKFTQRFLVYSSSKLSLLLSLSQWPSPVLGSLAMCSKSLPNLVCLIRTL